MATGMCPEIGASPNNARTAATSEGGTVLKVVM
jgi:hypothetical protein